MKVLDDALQFTPRDLHQMKGLIKLHNPDRFLEDSSFGFDFRDLQKLTYHFGPILGGFLWNSYKNFTSDARQGNA